MQPTRPTAPAQPEHRTAHQVSKQVYPKVPRTGDIREALHAIYMYQIRRETRTPSAARWG